MDKKYKEIAFTIVIIIITIVNFFIPDPIPFLDELALSIYTIHRLVR